MDRLERDLAFFKNALTKTKNREERQRIQGEIKKINEVLLRRIREENRTLQEYNRNLEEAVAIIERKKAIEKMRQQLS